MCRSRKGYVRGWLLILACWAVTLSVAVTSETVRTFVPTGIWLAGSLVALVISWVTIRRLGVWSRGVERKLAVLRGEVADREAPECPEPLFNRLYVACEALIHTQVDRRVREGLGGRASRETIEALSASSVGRSPGHVLCELPIYFSEPAVDLDGFRNPSVLRDLVSRQTDALWSNGAILDGLRWAEVAAFFPPGPEAPERACLAALACQSTEGRSLPIAAGIVLSTFGVAELTEGNLTVYGTDTALVRQLARASRLLGAGVITEETIYRRTSDRFVWRRLGKFKLAWRRAELFEVLELRGPQASLAVALAEAYELALRDLETRDWNRAAQRFKECLRISPGDGPSRMCLNFSQRFRNNPPTRNWDGTLVLSPDS